MSYKYARCTRLINVKLSNSVRAIENSTFYGCSNLVNISLPRSVKAIGKSAFEGCKGLLNIALPNTIQTIEERAFSGCAGLTGISIPGSVTRIGASAFEGCSDIITVTLGGALKNISRNAFMGCEKIRNIYMINLYPPEWDRTPEVQVPFEKYVIWYATLHVPVGSKRVYAEGTADTWGQFFNIVEDLTGIKRIGLTENDNSASIYFDLLGRRADHPVAGQMYIVNGKKVVK